MNSFEVSMPIHKAASAVEWDARDSVDTGYVRQAVDLHNVAMTLRDIASCVARAHTAMAIVESL